MCGWGRELTGQLLCASLLPELVEPTKQHFRRLFKGPCIGHTTGVVPVSDRNFQPFEVLDLPICMADGADGLLHIINTGA